MKNLDYMLTHFDRTRVQLSPEDQDLYGLPKHTTVGEVRKALKPVEVEVPEEDTMDMIIEPNEETQL
jgi:hypothetical protein